MRLLIGYDGSECSKATIADLGHAGLPTDVEATVLCVAETWLPPADIPGLEPAVSEMPAAVKRALHQAEATLAASRQTAEEGAALFAASYPSWKISAAAVADSPAWGAIRLASESRADLIVVGSHGYSGFNPLALGSVSTRIVSESPCSVRVSRLTSTPPDKPPVIVVGIDGSPDAELAVTTVAGRHWPSNTEVHLVCATDERLSTEVLAPSDFVSRWIHPDDDDPLAWIARMIARYRDLLEAAGLHVHSIVNPGDPKRILLDAASDCHADSIFVGANGHSLLERLVLGSVSTSIVARAACSVEVVRTARGRKN